MQDQEGRDGPAPREDWGKVAWRTEQVVPAMSLVKHGKNRGR